MLGLPSDDPGFYGILRPRPESGYGIKQVDPETALLFLTLREPGPIPSYVRASLGEGWERTVTQLVLDGVLEVATDTGFLGGADAYATLCGPPPEPPASGILAQLSRDALLHAQDLAVRVPTLDAAVLADKLYLYNQLPLSPTWRKKLPDPPAVRRFLGLERGHRDGAWPGVPWQPAETSAGSWLSWHARGFRGFGVDGVSHCWKLYVSPRPEDLPRVFAAAVDRLHGLGAVSFKVGAEAQGVLRPDKMVVYFPGKERMLEAGLTLAAVLHVSRPQGVPFTADIEGTGGLLSWGVDRLPAADEPSWLPTESWRVRVTHRLAVALVAAVRRNPRPVEPWRFALGRVRLEGIDPATWAPLDTDEPVPEGKGD